MNRTEGQAGTTSSSKSPRRRLGRKTAGSAIVVVILAVGLLWWVGGSGRPAGGHDFSPVSASPTSGTVSNAPPSTVSSDQKNVESAGTAPVSEEQKLAQQIVGEWEQFNKGKRLLTVRDDGTATMKVTLDGAWSYVVGEKLEFEIEWKIEGKRLLFHMKSGKPEGSMKVITSIYGNERNHRIDELTSKKMVLVDEQDESRDKWTRLASAKSEEKK